MLRTCLQKVWNLIGQDEPTYHSKIGSTHFHKRGLETRREIMAFNREWDKEANMSLKF